MGKICSHSFLGLRGSQVGCHQRITWWPRHLDSNKQRLPDMNSIFAENLSGPEQLWTQNRASRTQQAFEIAIGVVSTCLSQEVVISMGENNDLGGKKTSFMSAHNLERYEACLEDQLIVPTDSHLSRYDPTAYA